MAALTLTTDHCLDPANLRTLYDHVTRELPTYARPLLVRDLGTPVVTSTFKQRKVELVTQGFDLSTSRDPVYFLDATNSTYTRLTQDNLSKLLTSKL